jgi:glycosyltransferase involved in cell wall biosynthesis
LAVKPHTVLSLATQMPQESRPDVSVVVPVLNGESTLQDLFARISTVLSGMHLDFEIIFVDDGSTDGSWKIIHELKASSSGRVRGLKLARNYGQQAATVCGLQQARGHWVLTLDDDLQTPPEEIPKLWNYAHDESSDVVYGICPDQKHDLLHRIGSSMFRVLVRKVAPSLQSASSFRLIRREILESFHHNLGAWLFLDPALAWFTSDMATVEVRHEKRLNGRSGYSLAKLAHMAITILVIYSTLPLQFMIWFGLLSAVVSFCIGIYYLIIKLTSNVPPGFSALIVMMTFAFGVILLSLGVLGIYISKIYNMNTGQPSFAVRSEI